jgi:hypothetical protein
MEARSAAFPTATSRPLRATLLLTFRALQLTVSALGVSLLARHAHVEPPQEIAPERFRSQPRQPMEAKRAKPSTVRPRRRNARQPCLPAPSTVSAPSLSTPPANPSESVLIPPARRLERTRSLKLQLMADSSATTRMDKSRPFLAATPPL